MGSNLPQRASGYVEVEALFLLPERTALSLSKDSAEIVDGSVGLCYIANQGSHGRIPTCC